MMNCRKNKIIANVLILFFISANIYMFYILIKSAHNPHYLGTDNKIGLLLNKRGNFNKIVDAKFCADTAGIRKMFCGYVSDTHIYNRKNKMSERTQVPPVIIQEPAIIPAPVKPRLPLFHNIGNFRYSGYIEIKDFGKIKYEACLKNILTNSGGYYAEGEKLENIAEIKNISTEQVILIYNNDLYVLKYNGSRSEFYSIDTEAISPIPAEYMKYFYEVNK